MSRRPGLAGVGWSAGYSIVTRASTLLAVPLVLGGVGVDLYAVWVLAGVLIMSQGLVDLGMGAALVRFVSVSATEGSRDGILLILRRAGWFYVLLSLLVGVPMWTFASTIAGALDYIDAAEAGEATAILRYAAASFALTNLTMVFAATLQGLDRVDAAFRGQAIGWVLYVPILAGGMAAGLGVHAIGIAWIVSYVVQASITGAEMARSLRRYAPGAAAGPSIRMMLSLGGRWQVSSWADFATFQLPRVLGGALLTSEGLLALDLALRFAQVAVMPVFVVLPLVLPKASAAWGRGGAAGLSRLLDRLVWPAFAAIAVGSAAAAALAAPAISVWTSRPMAEIDPLLAAFVVIGVAAHASTGFLSAALLATGDIRLVVVYKYRQLGAALVLVSIGTMIGEFAAGAAVAMALLVPALLFNRDAIATLRLRPVAHDRLRAFPVATLAVGGATALIVAACRSSGLDPAATLAAAAAAAGAGGLMAMRALGLSVDALLTKPPADG